MANTSYTYSISGDFPNQKVDCAKFQYEIEQSSISSAVVIYVHTSGDNCYVWFDDPLSGADQTTLNGLVAAHDGEPLPWPKRFLPRTGTPTSVVLEDGDVWPDDATQEFMYYDGTSVQTFQWKYFSRNASGFLYPTTTTDNLYMGGTTPNAVLFNDGDASFGSAAMSGAERIRVVGGARIEKTNNAAIPALYIQVATDHPAAQQAVLLDVDVNSIAIDIDSEATGKPLINLQPILANTRGDIAFGTVRTADPSTPSEGDVWYNSTTKCLRFYNGSVSQCLVGRQSRGKYTTFNDGSNDYIRVSGTSLTVLGNFWFPGTGVFEPEMFTLIASRQGATGTNTYQLYDATNAQVLANIIVSVTAKAYYSTTSFSNLPTGGAIIEIRGMKSSGGAGNGQLHSWEFE